MLSSTLIKSFKRFCFFEFFLISMNKGNNTEVWMRSWLLAGSLLLLMVVCGCAKDLVTGKSTLNYYSVENEPKLGSQVLVQQSKAAKKKGSKMDAAADPVEYERLKRIVARIQPFTHYPSFPYEIHLVESKVVNAWCAPGGKMVVYTGLWDPKEGLVEKGNDDQLAAVIAHEIAHANARHVTESISRNMTIAIAGAAVQTAIAAGGSAQGANLFGEIFSDGMSIFVPSYSRSNEFEADRLGLIYMAKAGFDPRAAVELWRKAASRKKDMTSIFASHPSSGSRARALELMLPEALVYYNEAIERDPSLVKKAKPAKKRLER